MDLDRRRCGVFPVRRHTSSVGVLCSSFFPTKVSRRRPDEEQRFHPDVSVVLVIDEHWVGVESVFASPCREVHTFLNGQLLCTYLMCMKNEGYICNNGFPKKKYDCVHATIRNG